VSRPYGAGQISFPRTPFTSSGWLLPGIRAELVVVLFLNGLRKQLLTDGSKAGRDIALSPGRVTVYNMSPLRQPKPRQGGAKSPPVAIAGGETM